MKTTLRLGSLALIFSMILISCSKETGVLPGSDGNEAISASELTESFLQDITNFYEEAELQEDADGDVFFANEGIPYYLLTNPALADGDVMQKNGKGLCGLTGDLSLTKKQREALERYWDSYKNCIEKRRTYLKRLHEAMRLKHKARTAKLRRQLQQTDNPQVRKKILSTIKAYNESFARNMQEQGDRHLQAMQACYDRFLSSARSILTKAQYKAMIICLKKHADKAKDPGKKKHKKKKKHHKKQQQHQKQH